MLATRTSTPSSSHSTRPGCRSRVSSASRSRSSPIRRRIQRSSTGVRASLAAALKLGAGMMIAQAGDDRPGVPRGRRSMRRWSRCSRTRPKILEGSGVVLALEPLNDRVDHPGYYLTSTVEGLDIVDEVDRPEVRLLYDIYHSAMMGEEIETCSTAGSIASCMFTSPTRRGAASPAAAAWICRAARLAQGAGIQWADWARIPAGRADGGDPQVPRRGVGTADERNGAGALSVTYARL